MRKAFVGSVSVLDKDTMNSLLELQDFQMIYYGTRTSGKTGTGAVENSLAANNIAIRIAVPTDLGRVALKLDRDADGSDVVYHLYDNTFDPAGTTLGTLVYSGIVPAEFIPSTAGTVTLPLPLEGLNPSNYYWLILEQAGDATNKIDVIGETSADASHPVYKRNGSAGAWTSSNAIQYSVFQWDEVGDILAGIEGGQVSWLYNVNYGIFGTVGNCENSALWTPANATLANDTVSFVQGTQSIKVTIVAGAIADGTATYNIFSLLNSASYYFISGWIKHGGGAYYSWLRCIPNGAGASVPGTATITDTVNYVNTGFVLSPSAWGTGCTQIDLKMYVTGAATNFGNFDSIKIYEIPSADAALPVADLLEKYKNDPAYSVGGLVKEYSYIPAVNGDETKSIREIMDYTGNRKGVVTSA